MSESVRYHGVTYRRYPDRTDWATRVYFNPGQADRMAGYESLHREVYKREHGPIPEGHDIHHVDLNPLNNDPSNLIALTKSDHRKLHGALPPSAAQLAHFDRIRPLAAEWHRSDEGRAWHRAHGVEVMANRVPSSAVCEQCGAKYRSKVPMRFCSNKCKSAWRRASGVDDEQRTCEVCGAAFTVNRYSKKRACGRACGGVIANGRG